MMRAAYSMALAAVLAIASLSHGCGPVAPTVEPTPAEVLAKQVAVEALRAMLAETCRATTPPVEASTAHRLAWALVCYRVPAPGVGAAAFPPPPPALPDGGGP